MTGATGVLSDAMAASSAVQAAADLGVLEHLQSAPATAEQVSAARGLDARMTALLLDALVACGAAERVQGAPPRYAARIGREELALMLRLWASLPDAVRTGCSVIDVGQRDVAATSYATMVERIGRFAAPAAATVTDLLAHLGPRLLDLGAGAAPFARAMLAAGHDLEVTAVDLPGVIDVTRRVAERDGFGDRFSFVAGDLFSVDVGRDFDLVLLSGVCRLYDETTNATLALRVADLVRPGGTVAIVDAVPDADGADAHMALYALSLALRTARGGVHPFSSYASWLHAAGFEGIELFPLPAPGASLIRATRPG